MKHAIKTGTSVLMVQLLVLWLYILQVPASNPLRNVSTLTEVRNKRLRNVQTESHGKLRHFKLSIQSHHTGRYAY